MMYDADPAGGESMAEMGHIDKRTLAERAYDAVRKLLLNEEIGAGETLCIDDLACQLNVSTTPIREALSRFESEGLISLPPSKQPVVRRLSGDEVKTLYDVRSVLEPYLMGLLATQAATKPDVREQLEDLLHNLRDGHTNAGSTTTDKAPIKVDHRLGEILLAACGNPLLESLLRLLNNHILLLRLTSADAPEKHRGERREEVSQEHCVLVAAILDGNKSAIDKALAEHLSRSSVRSTEALG